MKTKFNVNQKVWYLDIVKDAIIEDTVTGILVTDKDEVYMLESGLKLPLAVVFGAKEQCRIHYQGLLR